MNSKPYAKATAPLVPNPWSLSSIQNQRNDAQGTQNGDRSGYVNVHIVDGCIALNGTDFDSMASYSLHDFLQTGLDSYAYACASGPDNFANGIFAVQQIRGWTDIYGFTDTSADGVTKSATCKMQTLNLDTFPDQNTQDIWYKNGQLYLSANGTDDMVPGDYSCQSIDPVDILNPWYVYAIDQVRFNNGWKVGAPLHSPLIHVDYGCLLVNGTNINSDPSRTQWVCSGLYDSQETGQQLNGSSVIYWSDKIQDDNTDTIVATCAVKSC